MGLRTALARSVAVGIVIAIIGIVIGASIGYYLSQTGVKTVTVPTTITKTVTKTVTSVYTTTYTLTKAGATPSTVTTTVPVAVTKTVTSTVTKTTTTSVLTTTTIATTKTTTTTTTVSLAPITHGYLHKTVIYIIQNDASARVFTLKKGVADLAAIPPDQLSAVNGTKIGNYRVIVRELGLSFDIVFIVLNTLKPPFDNPLVRQALAYATPYKMIWETVYHNTVVWLPGVIPKGMLGWTDFNVIHYTFNLAKAKELIKKAGIDPSKYTIVIYYNQGNTARAKIATLLSTYWSELGFKVMVQALSWPQLLERTEKPEFDVYIIGWAPDYVDPDDYAGPLLYGGTKFDFVKVYTDVSASDVGKYLASAKVIETPKYYVIVGPAGTGAKVSLPKSKPIILVQYKLAKKQIPPQNCTAFVSINPAFYRNTTIDALVIAGREIANPAIREPIYQAIEILSNRAVPIIWLGQYKIIQVYWSWVHGMYVNPVLGIRFDLIYETKPPVTPAIGIGNYVNNATTLVFTTIGWPQSFDPAKDYETFGWQIFHQVGDTLVTYWKSDFTHVVPDLAVAWCHSKNGTLWFFVIRGGVKAYDPWHNKVYPINATDVLFTLWRIARLNLDPSWMITSFIDVNHSKVLTEKEFDELLKKEPMIAEYHGKTITVTSLSQLLSFFGYSGKTAGVVMLRLYKPYAAILNILADPFTMVIPAKYLFDNVPQLKGKYLEAMEKAKWGKNPAAWATYIKPGESDPTHVYLNKYLIGTGPYYIAGYKRDSYIILKINPYYWNATLWEKLYGYKP